VLVEQIERGEIQDLVVDLTHLVFMDSNGIGALVAGYGAARQAGVRFLVRVPSGFVYRQLNITGLAGLSAAQARRAPIAPAPERVAARVTTPRSGVEASARPDPPADAPPMSTVAPPRGSAGTPAPVCGTGDRGRASGAGRTLADRHEEVRA
jgi:hypothetical protein